MQELLRRKRWQQDQQSKSRMQNVPRHSEIGTIPEWVPGMVT